MKSNDIITLKQLKIMMTMQIKEYLQYVDKEELAYLMGMSLETFEKKLSDYNENYSFYDDVLQKIKVLTTK